MTGSPYLPALLLLVFGTWCGTFAGAAAAPAALAGHLVLLGVLAWAGRGNPLRLSRRGNLLLLVFLCTLVVSLAYSPVHRAGQVGMVLLPTFLMVPAAVEQCWRDRESRRSGVRTLTLAVAVIAALALLGWWRMATPRPTLPLGHHNLLAAWLVTLLPLAVLPWRDGGAARWLAASAGLLAAAVLAASRSLGALLAVTVMLGVALALERRWILATSTTLLAALAAWPRLRAVLAGQDLSVEARQSYLEAAWRGFLERPWIGWGPGSASWSLHLYLRPRPGVHPPDQVVADPHSMPLRLFFEIGLAGVALFVAVVVAVVLTRRREPCADAGLRRAAWLGLLGFAVASSTGRPPAAPALVLAGLVVLGALQASGPPRPPPTRRRWLLPALALAALLAAPDWAHLAYDRATGLRDPREQAVLLWRAVELDPDFPLYRVRLALLDSGRSGEASAGAELARGIAHFHLLAGVQGQADDALLRACELNPLGALAPFRLAMAADDDRRAAVWAARALLAEPLLLAAEDFQARPELVAAALAELRGTRGVEPSWTEELTAAWERLRGVSGPRRRLVLEMDAEPATALSLHAFRRRPWPAYVDEVRLISQGVGEITVASPARRRGTEPRLFQASECGLPD